MRGHEDNKFGAFLHFGNPYKNSLNSGSYKTLSYSLADEWHIYGLIWSETSMEFTFDGDVWQTVNLSYLGSGYDGPFADIFTNRNGFSIVFCLAIGGDYLGGQLPLDSAFTDDAVLEDRCLEVDWVRVFSK
jgi:hypothetical protein